MLGPIQGQEHLPDKVAARVSGLEAHSHSGSSCSSVWKLKAMIAGKEKYCWLITFQLVQATTTPLLRLSGM
jgi:hypothetical protein